jgi:hypothetical protein
MAWWDHRHGPRLRSPRASAATDAVQRLADRLVAEALDRLAEEGLEQQRLGLGLRNAARASGRRAPSRRAGRTVAPWPHCTSSAKISSSGLLIGLRRRRRGAALRHHPPVGLLRLLGDTILPCKTRAARPRRRRGSARGSRNPARRGSSTSVASPNGGGRRQHGRGPRADAAVGAGEIDEALIAGQRRPEVHDEAVERAAGIEAGEEGGDVQRRRALLLQAGPGDARAIGNVELDRALAW